MSAERTLFVILIVGVASAATVYDEGRDYDSNVASYAEGTRTKRGIPLDSLSPSNILAKLLNATGGDPWDLDSPDMQVLSPLEGKSNEVEADRVIVLDSKTIMLEKFYYDGNGGKGVHFCAGRGWQPNSQGMVVPNALGYIEPLRRYVNEDVILVLPGELTTFEIGWFAIYDIDNDRSLGHVFIPGDINVPLSLNKVVPFETVHHHCQMLHSNLAVAWTLSIPTIRIELIGNIKENEYMGFGFSQPGASKMVGADVGVGYLENLLGVSQVYNITAKSPCTRILGVNQGVCPKSKAHPDGTIDYHLHTFAWENGITKIGFVKTLPKEDDGGVNDGVNSIVWAIGKLARPGGRKARIEPSFHHTYPKDHVQLDLQGNVPEIFKCRPFVKKAPRSISRATEHGIPDTDAIQYSLRKWRPHKQIDYSLRTFDAWLGPPGGEKGYSGITGMPSNRFVWYINGYVASELYMRRGFTYTFRVEGGDDPNNPNFYNPLVISTDPVGGYERLSNDKNSKVKVLAGVEYTQRGVPRAFAAGRLCAWTHPETADRRLDDSFETFERFRSSLELECSKEGNAAVLTVTPNFTWPDVVYYNSYTHPFMGWKINIVDDFNQLQEFDYGSDGTPKFSSHLTGFWICVIALCVLFFLSLPCLVNLISQK